jgi:hypothetical protein
MGATACLPGVCFTSFSAGFSTAQTGDIAAIAKSSKVLSHPNQNLFMTFP